MNEINLLSKYTTIKNPILIVAIICFLFSPFFDVKCQIPEIALDIQRPINGIYRISDELNGFTYFSAYTVTTGIELYKTDGTTTTLVSDINPGANDGVGLIEIMIMGNRVFFEGSTSLHGRELWSSDGTSAGTTMVADLVLGSEGSYPSNLTIVGSLLYFTMTEGTTIKLYKTDGTASGTTFVSVLNPNTNVSMSILNFKAVGNTLCFTKTDFSTYLELWSSDGINTTLLKSFAYSFLYNTEVYNGKYYLSGNDGIHGNELWRTDGTLAGTELFIDLTEGSFSSNVSQLVVKGSELMFINGNSIYKTDGTTAGTQFVHFFLIQPNYLQDAGSYVVFLVTYNAIQEIWRSDGTIAGTFMLTKQKPSDNANNDFTGKKINNSTFVFTIDSYEGGGQELWKTDGTVSGTQLIQDIRTGIYGSSPTDFHILGNNLVFKAYDDINGEEIWKTDGTNTNRVTSILPDAIDSNPAHFQILNNTLYFTASRYGVTNPQLHWYNPNSISSNYSNETNGSEFFLFNNKVYFSGRGSNGFELYAYSSATLTSSQVKDIHVGVGDSSPKNFIALGSSLFFTAKSQAEGRELWKTDGTNAGTVLVSDIQSGPNNSDPRNLTYLNSNTFLFFATDDLGYTYLFKHEPSTSTTSVLWGSPTFEIISSNSELVVMGSYAYFSSRSTNTNNYELWRTDGTTTTLVKEINASGSSNPSKLKVINSTLFFEANDGLNGRELWKSDGTSAGTVMVKDINPGVASSNIKSLFEYNGIAYLSALTASGNELWRSDGTSAGTYMVKDINPTGDSAPSFFCIAKNWLYFAAADGKHGRELWKTDGTTEGTVLVMDMYHDKANNLNSSNPEYLTEINGILYFAGNNGKNGRELYKLNPCLSGNIFNPYASGTSHSTGTITPSWANIILPNHTYNYFSEKSIVFNTGFI
ncbi:MAG: ELWxxDGT repeat protein, partial [Leadbetterella sp.]